MRKMARKRSANLKRFSWLTFHDKTRKVPWVGVGRGESAAAGEIAGNHDPAIVSRQARVLRQRQVGMDCSWVWREVTARRMTAEPSRRVNRRNEIAGADVAAG